MKKLLCVSLLITAMNSFATGMVPETSVLLVNESKGEASMNITNTDGMPALLYTNIVDLPGSNKSVRLIASQPVVRVEAGQVQRIRFLLQSDKPLTSEEFKRVTFEGIPPKEKGSDRVAITMRQDLPVIIHPAGLAEDLQPWKHLVWSKNGQSVTVSNPSDYVVRMTAAFKTLPSGRSGKLDKTYLLPHTRTVVALPFASDSQVEFYPATRYGYKGDAYTTELK